MIFFPAFGKGSFIAFDCIGVSGFCIGFHFLIASDSSLALILSHFSQLLCCFFIGLGKLYKGFTLCLSLGSSCPRVFSLAFCHHSGIFGVCRHAFFLTLLFSLSGYGFFFFQGLPFLGGFRVCLGGFFQKDESISESFIPAFDGSGLEETEQ